MAQLSDGPNFIYYVYYLLHTLRVLYRSYIINKNYCNLMIMHIPMYKHIPT